MTYSVYYTYRITHIPSGKHYYGAEWNKDAHPNNLWKTYFTSSNIVDDLIIKDGKDSFTYEIRRTFSTSEACFDWETKVLRKLNVSKNPNWLNEAENYGSEKFFYATKYKTQEHRAKIAAKSVLYRHTQESKDKISQKNSGLKRTIESRLLMSNGRLGENNHFYGKTHSIETKLKISVANSGKIRSQEAIEATRQANLGRKQTEYQKKMAADANSKKWKVTTPSGETIEIVNLRQYCFSLGFNDSGCNNMPRTGYKGYRAIRQ